MRQNPGQKVAPRPAATKLKVPELASRLGVPARTVQRYLSRHSRHLDATRIGQGGWLVSEDLLPTLMEIRDRYQAGGSVVDVEESLEAAAGVTRATGATAPEPAEECGLPSAVEELRDQIEATTSTVEELQDRVEPLEGTVESLERAVEDLRDKVDALESTIETMEEQRDEDRLEIEGLRDLVDGMEREYAKHVEALAFEAQTLIDRLEEALTRRPSPAEGSGTAARGP